MVKLKNTLGLFMSSIAKQKVLASECIGIEGNRLVVGGYKVPYIVLPFANRFDAGYYRDEMIVWSAHTSSFVTKKQLNQELWLPTPTAMLEAMIVKRTNPLLFGPAHSSLRITPVPDFTSRWV